MSEDEAKRRFMLLTTVRFGGLMLALLGVTIIATRFVEPADLIGYSLVAAGAFEVIVMPQLLVRRWKR